MGAKFYTALEYHLDVLNQKNTCMVEIGSERGEGSTDYFKTMSNNHNVPFYTVDLVENDIEESHLTKKYTMTGEDFLEKISPSLNKKISVLYLDNFDWMWNTEDQESYKCQVDLYREKGLTMSNVNSTTTHLKQMIFAEPYMAEKSIVICDDTFYMGREGTYAGKCSAVIYYLLAKGWSIVAKHDFAIALRKN